MLYWFSLLQCWLLQLQLYTALLYSYSLNNEFEVSISFGHTNSPAGGILHKLLVRGPEKWTQLDLRISKYERSRSLYAKKRRKKRDEK